MKLFYSCILLFASAFVGTPGVAIAQELPEKSTDSFWRNDPLVKALTSVKSHSLADVAARPEAYRSLPVQMDIQFHETRKGGNPFFTRFTEENYLCFAAWSGESALWKREDYERSHPFLFVDRKSPDLRVLLEAKIYNRIRVTAIVRDVFKGIAYIEVSKAQILDQAVTEATIIHGAKAQKLAHEGDTAGALAEYDRAMRGDIPETAKAQLYIDMAQVFLQRSERDRATAQLENAKKLRPNDASLTKTIDRIKSAPANASMVELLQEIAKPEPAKESGAASRPAAAQAGAVKPAAGAATEK